MFGTIATQLSASNDDFTKRAMRHILTPIANVISGQMLGSAGLVISAAAAVTAKTGAVAVNATVNGRLLSIPAGTVLPALAGTTPINTFNIYVFYTNNAGVLTSNMGIAAATLGGVIWPQTALGSVIVGALTVNPTTAPFIGGTTALDAVSTNVVYISPVGAFDPSINYA